MLFGQLQISDQLLKVWHTIDQKKEKWEAESHKERLKEQSEDPTEDSHSCLLVGGLVIASSTNLSAS